MVVLSIIPGILFFKIYTRPDVRIAASKWIYANVPDGSYILSETGNVVDLPVDVQGSRLKAQGSNLEHRTYNVVSFDFYHLDSNPELQKQLVNHLVEADYLMVPSRRIFANLPADEAGNPLYPITFAYYNSLFSGTLGFEQVVECDFMGCKQDNLSSPYHVKIFDFVRGEAAEETWSVFDHPVVRVYKKTRAYDKNYYEKILSPE